MDRPYDIQERTFLFATEVVQFCRSLGAAHPVTRRISWQLLDSATSVGANMAEADGGQSKPDFRSKVSTARKESHEVVFWLRLIAATDRQQQGAAVSLLGEAKQLAAIISTIKKNSEANDNRGRPD